MMQATKPTVPTVWKEFREAFAAMAGSLAEGNATARQRREQVRQAISTQRQLLTVPAVSVPREAPPDIARAVKSTLGVLQEQSLGLLADLDAAAEDFKHAEENEDRFIVLTFGEVNSGKSALSNHLAGLEFGLPPEECGQCFCRKKAVPRLEESPIECTRDYQGFRLPGLLWIDCPGVLSTTPANAERARRLVARADFLIFVTSSDAPFRESEMMELERLIRESGNEGLDACLVVTKSDEFDEDDDPATGKLVRRCLPKSAQAQTLQADWAREQLDRTGLGKLVRLREPLAVSVYSARDQLGLHWETTRSRRAARGEWEQGYEESGMARLCRGLTRLVRKHGVAMKSQWPRKRTRALQRILEGASAGAVGQVEGLRARLREQRVCLVQARPAAAKDAALRAAAGVRDFLVQAGIEDIRTFDRGRATEELRALLQRSVTRAMKESAGPILDRALQAVDAAVAEFASGCRFQLELRERTRRQTYLSSTRSQTVGRTGGGLGGMAVGGFIGSFFAPVIGTFLGGLLGGILGSWFGKEVGGRIQESRTVEVAYGTNTDEVITATQEAMKDKATRAVAEVFSTLERTIFVPLEAELDRVLSQIRQWPAVVQG